MYKYWKLDKLPLQDDVENKEILKLAANSRESLAELKGMASTIPNQNILLNAITLKESKESSAVENIVTTHDEIYKAELNLNLFESLEAKEVRNYFNAIKIGYQQIIQDGIIRNTTLLEIHKVLEGNDAGFRKQAGTTLKNDKTGEIIYTPPQHIVEIKELMQNLELFINNDDLTDLDPLVKMAIIHHQFESIHPFYDGNGRCGRILNILYMVNKGLLNSPILYLSKFIIENKQDYYKYLQEVRSTGNWTNWLKFMIIGVGVTANQTVQLILEIKQIMGSYKNEIRNNYKFYSQDLLNNLFTHPYTKIEYLQNDLKVSRLTAANYLNKLADDGLLKKEKYGPANYYVNEPLFEILSK